MSTDPSQDKGPDLTQGVATEALADGSMLVGHVGEDAVLLARRGDEYFAIGAECSHYHGPLAEGLMVGDTVRCPWHHACFSLRTGEAVRAPALAPSRAGPPRSGRARSSCSARWCRSQPPAPRRQRGRTATEIVIVGGGAAGFAAAEMLRRQHYQGSIVMLSDDDAPPGRSAEPVQGLPGRQRARGMGAAARG